MSGSLKEVGELAELDIIKKRVLFNDREPENTLYLRYNKLGELYECWGEFTWNDHIDFETGEPYYVRIGIETKNDTGQFVFYVRYVDEDKRDMDKEVVSDDFQRAWKQLPALITHPDDFEDYAISLDDSM